MFQVTKETFEHKGQLGQFQRPKRELVTIEKEIEINTLVRSMEIKFDVLSGFNSNQGSQGTGTRKGCSDDTLRDRTFHKENVEEVEEEEFVEKECGYGNEDTPEIEIIQTVNGTNNQNSIGNDRSEMEHNGDY